MRKFAVLSTFVFFIINGCSSITAPSVKPKKMDISFYLQKKSFVKLSIQNIHGDIIKTLLSKELSLGSYTETWYGKNDDGNYVNEGFYFTSLNIDYGEMTYLRIFYYGGK